MTHRNFQYRIKQSTHLRRRAGGTGFGRRTGNLQRQLRWLLPAALLFAMPVAAAVACRIPVFRYALERWEPAPFEVVVLHRGPLGESDQALVESLKSAASNEQAMANMRISVIDLDEVPDSQDTSEPQDAAGGAAPAGHFRGQSPVSPKLKRLFAEKFPDLDRPHVLVAFPSLFGEFRLAWQGPLEAEPVQRLVDSPLRQQIARRLLDGETAVWVLIECGDEEKDKQAEATLRNELARMEDTLELPTAEELAAEAEFQGDIPIELRIDFSLLRVSRTDPQEEIFVSMLLHSEEELGDQEPIAIPIYGRGRTFYALVGNGINAEMVEENCRFLCGDCSCQVKEQNPGSDLLFAVSWQDHILGSAMPLRVLPELSGIGALVESASSQPAAPETPETTKSQTVVASVADTATPVESSTTEPAAVQQQTSTDEVTLSTVEPTPSVIAEADASFSRTLLFGVLAVFAFVLVVVAGTTIWLRSHASRQ